MILSAPTIAAISQKRPPASGEYSPETGGFLLYSGTVPLNQRSVISSTVSTGSGRMGLSPSDTNTVSG